MIVLATEEENRRREREGDHQRSLNIYGYPDWTIRIVQDSMDSTKDLIRRRNVIVKERVEVRLPYVKCITAEMSQVIKLNCS